MIPRRIKLTFDVVGKLKANNPGQKDALHVASTSIDEPACADDLSEESRSI